MIGKINDRLLYKLGVGDRFTYISDRLQRGDTCHSRNFISEEIAKALLGVVGRSNLDNKDYVCVHVDRERGRRMIVYNHDGEYSQYWVWPKGDE